MFKLYKLNFSFFLTAIPVNIESQRVFLKPRRRRCKVKQQCVILIWKCCSKRKKLNSAYIIPF
jgi:hypothetical protein